MATWIALVVNGSDSVRMACAKRRIELPAGSRPMLVSLRGGFSLFDDAPKLGESIARETGTNVMVLMGQTSVDVYSVEEFASAGLLRRVRWNRDARTLEETGVMRAWEAALHFSLPRDRFLEYIEDSELTPEEISAGTTAYDEKSVERLPKRVGIHRSTFEAFLATLGEPVVADRRGWLAKLLNFD